MRFNSPGVTASHVNRVIGDENGRLPRESDVARNSLSIPFERKLGQRDKREAEESEAEEECEKVDDENDGRGHMVYGVAKYFVFSAVAASEPGPRWLPLYNPIYSSFLYQHVPRLLPVQSHTPFGDEWPPFQGRAASSHRLADASSLLFQLLR